MRWMQQIFSGCLLALMEGAEISLSLCCQRIEDQFLPVVQFGVIYNEKRVQLNNLFF